MNTLIIFTTIALLNALMFLIGWKIGSLKQAEHQHHTIEATGFFMLKHQVYRAVKLGIDPKARPPVDSLPEMVELPETAHHFPPAFDYDDEEPSHQILISETPATKKTIRRRLARNAS